ncbi:MAG: fumarylacetoacetate hydrolase family protein [Burkholderiales bacterium]|jgi:2-oxo-3-hexenedioate decarboxylase/2-keto-4-pentenoate hydratase
MTDTKRWKRAAERIVQQRIALTPMEALPARSRPQDEAQGYALQSEVNRLLSKSGFGRVVGHKIGCTTPVMQAFLGIPNPCAGDVFEETVCHGSATVPRSGFVKVGIECEIAVELGRNIFPSDGPFTRESIASAVHSVMAAIEIVDDRYRDYSEMGVPTLIGDDFFDSGCVLGEPLLEWRELDLAALSGATSVNGEEVGRGTGSLIMGHPFEALAWLAQSRAARGMGLKQGEFVLLGSIVETKWLNAGDDARIEIEALGGAHINIT